jgi:hypothetical protein
MKPKMYKCSECGKSSLPGQGRLTHVIFRVFTDPDTGRIRKDIESEKPVCRDCAGQYGPEIPRDLPIKIPRAEPGLESTT